jgi:plastocyanin
MMRTMAVVVISVILAVGMLTGCGGGGEPSAPPNTGGQPPTTETPYATGTTTAQPAGPEIVIANFAYTVPASVKPGERITIRNNAEENHTVTADENNLFDVRISGGGGISTLTAPTTPGTYPFHCKYHANMRGSLTVQ